MPKKMNITQKDLDRVKKRCLESLGDFLSELCRDKLMGPTSVEKIFSFDHTTFKRICEKDQTITVKTMARTMGIIASFLNGLKETCDKELKNLQEDDKMKLSLKRKKIDVLNKKRMKCTEAMEKYKKTFGIIAISFLELIGQNDEFKSLNKKKPVKMLTSEAKY